MAPLFPKFGIISAVRVMAAEFRRTNPPTSSHPSRLFSTLYQVSGFWIYYGVTSCCLAGGLGGYVGRSKVHKPPGGYRLPPFPCSRKILEHFFREDYMEHANISVVRLGGACEHERPLVTFGRSSSPRVFLLWPWPTFWIWKSAMVGGSASRDYSYD
jgi:hypothetical protein